MPHDVRALADDEILQAEAVFRTAMVGFPPPDATAEELAELYEPGRVLGVHDGGELVGTAKSSGSWMVVPGGKRVPHPVVRHRVGPVRRHLFLDGEDVHVQVGVVR